MDSIKPDTRARTSTVATGTKRPVYSSHSVIDFCSGFETVTGGGGDATPAPGLLSQPAKTAASNAATIKRRAPIIGPYLMAKAGTRKRQTSRLGSFLLPAPATAARI